MNTFIKKSLTLVLIVALLFNYTVTAMAAPSRNKGTVKYLSDIVLIEASSDEKADAIFAELQKEENGAFEAKISLDLNNGGDNKVYLAYKSSTNVDDAITDISVMNMYGDFTVGSYEQIYNATLEKHLEVANDYRIMAEEFKRNYAANDAGALTAYRQMNYYYIEEDGVKTYMGDYFLNFPEDGTQFAKVLFGGNLNIVANLRALMSMGIGDTNATLKDRITASYALAETDSTIYSNFAYEEVAEALKTQTQEMKNQINTLPDEIQSIEESDLEDEYKENSIAMATLNLENANAYFELLNEIQIGDNNLGDLILETPVLETTLFFPIAAAATQAESLMMEYNSFYTLLLYDVLETLGAELDAALADIEKDYEPLSVYYGVQNDLAEGTIGVTGDAQLLTSTTGRSFFSEAVDDSVVTILGNIGFGVLGAAGIASIIGGSVYLSVKRAAAEAVYKPLAESYWLAYDQFVVVEKSLNHWVNSYVSFVNTSDDIAMADQAFGAHIREYSNQIASAHTELTKASEAISGVNPGLTSGQIALGSFFITLGAVMIGISIWQLIEINSKYEPTYTDIPDNMVSVVTNETYGDRFINYKNVPSYYYDGDTIKTRENDTNGYDGNQWVSLYYTKNYEAGNCLTTSADLIATETVRSGYSAIHLFAHQSNYNLNSYCNRDNASPVYLSFKYSTNQKSAATEVPDVVGSSFSGGMIAISGFSGLAIGLGLMAMIKRKDKPKHIEENDNK